jgi:hypothetical protein
MITLREPTAFDAAAPGDVVRVAEKRKNENLKARDIPGIRPEHMHDIRVETIARIRIGSADPELLSDVHSRGVGSGDETILY